MQGRIAERVAVIGGRGQAALGPVAGDTGGDAARGGQQEVARARDGTP